MSSGASSKDPRRRSRPNIASQSSAPTSQPQATRAVASEPPAAHPAKASPTAATPPNLNPPPAPATTLPTSLNSRHNFPNSNNYRPREERRAREDEWLREERHDKDNRRRRPTWKSEPSSNNDLATGGSSLARYSWTAERARGYTREPPSDPRYGQEPHHHSNRSATTNSGDLQGPPHHERVSRKPSPVRQGKSPASHGGRTHDPVPSLSTPRVSDDSSISYGHPAHPERGRSPPSTAKNQPIFSHSSSRDAVASHSSSATGRDYAALATRYKNPFARPSETNAANVGTTTMAGAAPIGATSTSKMAAGSTIATTSTDPRVPAGSGPTVPIDIEQDHAHSHRQERERGRSKSRHRSKSRARSRSEDRGRSKSRARSKSRFRSRSRSRPVRRVIAMGEVRVKRPRSPSRSRRRDDNIDSDGASFIDSESASSDSDSDANRYRSRSRSRIGRGDNRKKRRYRYYMSSESDESILNTTDESEGNALDSDMPLALHKSRLDPLPSSRATLNSDPSIRLDGPMTEMMNKVIIEQRSRIELQRRLVTPLLISLQHILDFDSVTL
ncbi:hypothetical protein EDD21DRAFT_149553 [Dissophora ornata]|nr:hypothetical protein EDD21DRAFT_149553 [Dissophora ornata]